LQYVVRVNPTSPHLLLTGGKQISDTLKQKHISGMHYSAAYFLLRYSAPQVFSTLIIKTPAILNNKYLLEDQPLILPSI
jgi:hypothetical protein